MASRVVEQAEYLLGRTEIEHRRLTRQARLIQKMTRHWLEQAGLATGMRVLDVGCGVGDVALQLASMVGAAGEVTGVDKDESAIHTARARAASAGLSNVEFHIGDLGSLQGDGKFDAAVGRCVLLHQQDPVAALAAVVTQVRSGGVVAFQEPWFSRGFSCPSAPLFDLTIGFLHKTVWAAGLDSDIGLRLPSIFHAAGLPLPKLSFEMLVACDPASEIYDFIADTARSLLPTMEQLGITTNNVLQVETLASRLRDEATTLSSVVGIMPLMGAWCTTP
jgi:SAM-dependent methyltransferase